jgi:hypothetical protein
LGEQNAYLDKVLLEANLMNRMETEKNHAKIEQMGKENV